MQISCLLRARAPCTTMVNYYYNLYLLLLFFFFTTRALITIIYTPRIRYIIQYCRVYNIIPYKPGGVGDPYELPFCIPISQPQQASGPVPDLRGCRRHANIAIPARANPQTLNRRRRRRPTPFLGFVTVHGVVCRPPPANVLYIYIIL